MEVDRTDSFSAAYDDHIWDVYGFFGYRLSSRETAEDLTQATFERALRAWDRFDESRASVRTWLLAIANNLLIDHYRRDRGAQMETIEEGDPREAELGVTADPGVSLGVSPELETALHGLGDRERELIALRFGGDLSGPEIAEVTGLTVANVQQILSRALRKMRAELEDSPERSSGGERSAAGDA